MCDRTGPAAYVPDRPPTWTEVGCGILAIVGFGPTVLLEPTTISWPGVVVGFLAFGVALGPLSTTTVGERIGGWFRRVGYAGRAIVIGLFAVVVGVLLVSDALPSAAVRDVGIGGLIACLLYLLAHVVRAGEVSGWWTWQQ